MQLVLRWLSDASFDGLGVVPGGVDVVEADWVDLVEAVSRLVKNPKSLS